MVSKHQISRQHDFAFQNKGRKSIDYTNLCLLPLFPLFCFDHRWAEDLVNSSPASPPCPTCLEALVWVISELRSCFAVRSGPHSDLPVLPDFPMDGPVHQSARRTPLKTPRQSLSLSSKSCASGVSCYYMPFQPCLPPQKVIIKLWKRVVTHKLQVLSFYSRTLKRSALSFLWFPCPPSRLPLFWSWSPSPWAWGTEGSTQPRKKGTTQQSKLKESQA